MNAMSIADVARAFLSMAAAGQVREAYALYVADTFRHHNAYFASDRQSLLEAMEASAEAEPNKAFTVRNVIASGDHVAVHSHLQRANGGGEFAVVHILRFEDGRIVEMWDIAQPVPAESPNELGMF